MNSHQTYMQLNLNIFAVNKIYVLYKISVISTSSRYSMDTSTLLKRRYTKRNPPFRSDPIQMQIGSRQFCAVRGSSIMRGHSSAGNKFPISHLTQ